MNRPIPHGSFDPAIRGKLISQAVGSVALILMAMVASVVVGLVSDLSGIGGGE